MTYALRFFGKRTWSPPLGLLTVAAMLPSQFERRLRDLNVVPSRMRTWPGRITFSERDGRPARIVAPDDRPLQAARGQGRGGGPLFTSDPGSFASVDHLVLNEAEVTLPGFLEDLAKGEAKPVYSTAEFADMAASPLPAYELLDTGGYGALSLQFSRGCPYQCEFCDVTALFGRRPRIKTAAQIIARAGQHLPGRLARQDLLRG